MSADTIVLFRWTGEWFAVTGWGVVAAFVIGGGIRELVREWKDE